MQQKSPIPDTFSPMHPQIMKLKSQLHRFYTIWLRLTGPDPRNFSPSIADQERLRRAHLLSALFPVSILALLLFIPDALLEPTRWYPMLLLVIIASCSLVFNRKGWHILSGFTYILAIDAAIILLVTTEPHGFRNSNITDLDLFLTSIMITSIVLPRSILLGSTLFHIFLVIMLFVFIPHDPLLNQEIQVNQDGLAYSEISASILLLAFGGIVGYLTSWSVNKALIRAGHAEELAETRASLQEKNQQIFEQNQRLEYGIHVIKETLSRSANKDYSVRAILTNNELTPLALGLNLMIERLNRMQRIEQEYHQLEQALQQLLEMRDRIARNDHHVPIYRTTGTVADQMYLLLERCHHSILFITKYRQTLEHLQTQFSIQKGQISHLSHLLSQACSLANQFHNTAATTSVSTNNTSANLSAIRKDHTIPDRRTLQSGPHTTSRQSAQQIDLIIEAAKICTQIQVTEKTCMQELTMLNQWSHGDPYAQHY